MADLFAQFWRCFTEIQVPVFGHYMSAADLVLGFFVCLFSIFVVRHLFWK